MTRFEFDMLLLSDVICTAQTLSGLDGSVPEWDSLANNANRLWNNMAAGSRGLNDDYRPVWESILENALQTLQRELQASEWSIVSEAVSTDDIVGLGDSLFSVDAIRRDNDWRDGFAQITLSPLRGGSPVTVSAWVLAEMA